MRRKPLFPIAGIVLMVCGLIALAFESWIVAVVTLAVGAVLVARGGERLSRGDRDS